MASLIALASALLILQWDTGEQFCYEVNNPIMYCRGNGSTVNQGKLMAMPFFCPNKVISTASYQAFIGTPIACPAASPGGGDDGNDGTGTTCNESTAQTGTRLHWTAPTKNADGTDLTDLAGYRVYCGGGQWAINDPLVTDWYLDATLTGVFKCDGVTAYDHVGNESALSNSLCVKR